MSEPSHFYFYSYKMPRLKPCLRCGGKAEVLSERGWMGMPATTIRGDAVYIRCEHRDCLFYVSADDVIGVYAQQGMTDIEKMTVVVSYWNRNDYMPVKISQAEHQAFKRWYLDNDRLTDEQLWEPTRDVLVDSEPI